MASRLVALILFNNRLLLVRARMNWYRLILRITAGLRHATGPCIKSCSSIEAPIQAMRACSASLDSSATSAGPSMSKDGWGRSVAIK